MKKSKIDTQIATLTNEVAKLEQEVEQIKQLESETLSKIENIRSEIDKLQKAKEHHAKAKEMAKVELKATQPPVVELGDKLLSGEVEVIYYNPEENIIRINPVSDFGRVTKTTLTRINEESDRHKLPLMATIKEGKPILIFKGQTIELGTEPITLSLNQAA